jgi:hypothetical protein
LFENFPVRSGFGLVVDDKGDVQNILQSRFQNVER